MHDHVIYALTPHGGNELRGGVTTLSPAQIELLVRIDGVLPLAKIRAGMSAISADTFASTFQSLMDRRLISVAEVDLFAERFQSDLNKLALSQAEAEADLGALSLRKTGYYVSIARPRGPARNPAAGEALTAVVVEDEPMLAKFIQSYLTFEGFQVRLAGNKAEIIAAIIKPPIPDLILLDVALPDADGFDILLRLRQHPTLKNVPVIMLTGKATREAVIKGLAGGADGYITKPFDADALMRAVRTVVGLPEDPATLKKAMDPWTNRDAKH